MTAVTGISIVAQVGKLQETMWRIWGMSNHSEAPNKSRRPFVAWFSLFCSFKVNEGLPSDAHASACWGEVLKS